MATQAPVGAAPFIGLLSQSGVQSATVLGALVTETAVNTGNTITVSGVPSGEAVGHATIYVVPGANYTFNGVAVASAEAVGAATLWRVVNVGPLAPSFPAAGTVLADFHEVRLDPAIEEGAIGGPSFSTAITTLSNGSEMRNVNWSMEQGSWEVGHGMKTGAQIATLRNFFYGRRGRRYGFRFRDPMDYQVPFPSDGVKQWVFATDGTTRVFQLFKTYTDDGSTYYRRLLKITPGTLQLFDGATLLTSPTDYTVDVTTGLVTLSVAMAAAGRTLFAACEFDVPVRFDVDDMGVQIRDYEVSDWRQITLVELKF